MVVKVISKVKIKSFAKVKWDSSAILFMKGKGEFGSSKVKEQTY